MEQKSWKYRIINTLIMNIPIAGSICVAAQYLSIHTFIFKLFCINFAIAYTLSCLVGLFVPAVPWGIKFALKCKTKPDTLPFGLAINVIVNLVYVVANSIVLTYFNACILNGAPLIGFFFGMISTFIPIYIVGYIVSFLWNKPAEIITSKICNE